MSKIPEKTRNTQVFSRSNYVNIISSLSPLSRHCPECYFCFLGLIRVELMTPSLSEKCSNRLSYKPVRNRKPLSKLINFYIKKVKGKKSRSNYSLNGLVVRLRLLFFVTIALCKVLEDSTQNSLSKLAL